MFKRKSFILFLTLFFHVSLPVFLQAEMRDEVTRYEYLYIGEVSLGSDDWHFNLWQLIELTSRLLQLEDYEVTPPKYIAGSESAECAEMFLRNCITGDMDDGEVWFIRLFTKSVVYVFYFYSNSGLLNPVWAISEYGRGGDE